DAFAEDGGDRLNGGGLPRGVLRGAGDVDENVRGLAELMQRHIADAEAAEAAAQRPEVGRLLRAHLDQQAAAEVDAEVEALHQDKRDRRDGDHRRDREEEVAPAEEVQAGIDRKLADQRHGELSSIARARWPASAGGAAAATA